MHHGEPLRLRGEPDHFGLGSDSLSGRERRHAQLHAAKHGFPIYLGIVQ